MRNPDLEARLQEAIALAQAGQRAEARAMLEAIVAEEPRQELAWVWLAAVGRDRGERLKFLRQALAINPSNSTARRAYEQLTGQPYRSGASPVASWDTGTTRAGLPSGNVLFIIAAILIVAAIIVLAEYLRGNGGADNDQPAAAASPVASLQAGAPTATEAPSATALHTPRPTITEGPSPTSVWEAPPATWTSAPTSTTAPSRTPAPTWTPRPTLTPSATLTPRPSATLLPLATAPAPG